MAQLDDLPPILDAAQVADLLGMNIQMVRRYAREGRIPAYKLPGGRTFKFFRDEVFDFVRQHPVVADDFDADDYESDDGAPHLEEVNVEVGEA
jgi:excisionase family DNA binding protein